MAIHLTTRHPSPVAIPRLRDKLFALYLLSGLNDAKLASMLGLTGRAIRNWVAGDGSRDPDHVPARHFQLLTQIFRSQLPQPHTAEEVRAWLLSPSQKGIVQALLSDAPALDWMTLVLAAERSTATVISAGATRQATMRRDPLDFLESSCHLAVGQLFRLQLEIPSQGWLCVVQWGRSGWFGLELADGEAVLQVQEGKCLLPPDPPYLKERELGSRRFVLMHSAQPFPPDVTATLLNSARPGAPLHADALVRLAHVVSANDVDMKNLDIDFTDMDGE
jgi:hypothetical protein